MAKMHGRLIFAILATETLKLVRINLLGYINAYQVDNTLYLTRNVTYIRILLKTHI